MKLRRLELLLTLSIAILASNVYAQNEKQLKKPNILWIVCEDMSRHLSCYGETQITTPNLDKLAKESIRYTHVYTTAGVCAPSRSSIITGMYPTSIGTSNMRTLARAPGKISEEVPNPYSAVLPTGVKGFPEFLRINGYYCTNNNKQDYQFRAPVTMWDESSPTAHWRNRPTGKPFFAVFNLGVTHEAQIWERSKEPLLVDPSTVIVPPYYPDVPEVRLDIARHLTNVIVMDRQAGRIIDSLKKDNLYDSTIIFFYSDHGDGLPFVKREILQRGLLIPLFVRLPGAVSGGTIDNRVISGLDFGPTVLALSNTTIPSYMHGLPFLGKGANKQGRKYVFAGRDRIDNEFDRVRTVMDTSFQYIRNYYLDQPGYQNSQYRLQMPMMKRIIAMRDSGLLNDKQMIWFKSPKAKEELYNLATDPYEFNNLANDSTYTAKLAELRKVYDEWINKYGDMSSVPEKEMLQTVMWKNAGKPPTVATPVVQKTGRGIRITSSTEGVSIGYKINASGPANEKNWSIYTGGVLSLNKKDEVIIQAERIGYTPATLTFTY